MKNNTKILPGAIFDELEKNGCIRLLSDEGAELSEKALISMAQFLDLIHAWNDRARLVGKMDLSEMIGRHVIDSLSLVGAILRMRKKTLLDIGSGGGFPAVPLKIVLPDLRMTLVERSERKVGILRKVVGELGLAGVRVLRGNFPEVSAPDAPDVITARAVENPEKVLRAILGYLPESACFLCQRTVTPDVGDMFHVEHIRDAWDSAGLRRGGLYIITHK